LYSLFVQPHILLLKIDFYTQATQIPQRTQHIQRIAPKAADRLCQDQVNSLLAALCDHPAKLWPFFCA
jgi:hypothetical protein